MKIVFCQIFFTLIFLQIAFGYLKIQKPTIIKPARQTSTINDLLQYCEKLRLNNLGIADNFVKLQAAGMKGLQLVNQNDYLNRSKFFFYTAIGNYYQVKFDSAQFYFYKSLDNAQKIQNVQQITKACVALIPVNFQLQQHQKVEDCKKIIQSIADTTKNETLLQDIDYALGSYYQQKSFYSTAQDYFIKSIKLREREVDTTKNLKKKFDYAIQCDMLSKLYLNTEMVDKSLEVLKKAQRFASVSPIVGNRLLSSFIEAFTSSGLIDSALYYNGRLEREARTNPASSSEVVSSDLNIALYYINKKQYQKVLPFLSKAEVMVNRVKSPLLTFQFQMVKGRYLQEIKQYDQSIALLTPALPIAKQLSKELSTNILKYLALDEKGKGRINNSLEYFHQYVTSLDTLTKEKISRTFADLQTHYQTNQKEQRIQSLDKENRLKVLELQNTKNQRQFLILGLAAFSLISLLLYFNYRNKEKLNLILNEKNHKLDQLNINLAEANETKARLFGIIGHDLRSPVSKIVQLMQLQKENPDRLSEADRKKYSEQLRTASENVLETMEDILLWSKSQMQKFKPMFSIIKIKPIIEREINQIQSQHENENLSILCQIPDTFVQTSDENFLAIIFRNLLQNAVRYGNKTKSISVHVSGQKVIITNYSDKEVAPFLNDRLTDARVYSNTSGLGLQIAADLANKINASLYFNQEHTNELQAILSWEIVPN